jgi:hypothetical protein
MHAEERALLVSGVFADSSIAGPVLRYTTGDAATNEYAIGIIGGTLDALWVKHRTPRHALVFAGEVTPFNAHFSNRIYLDGERMRELEYEAAAYRIEAGLRFTTTARSTTDVRLVGLVENISEPPDAALGKYWAEPFAGVSLSHTYKNLTKENPVVFTDEGFAIGANAESFAGGTNWSRFSMSERAAKRIGNIHVRQSLFAFSGSSLNIVNRFVLGGSWDALAERALYGFKYGEFRAARGVIANGGVDAILPRNWRAGVRASYLRSDVADTGGVAVNVTKTWSTFGLTAGVGRPSNRNDVVAYIAFIAPLYAK